MTDITTSIDINDHVNQAITDYLDMPPAPRYALCVTGEWGSGKTYLLKRRIAELESSGRPVAYVSLNGVSNTKQIDDALLDQFYPVLRSKKLKVASRLLTGVVKGFLKVDLEKAFDTDSKAVDVSVDISAPSSKMEDFLSKTNDSILFFDDIERSKLSIEEVLGYINYFVEHTGQKVLLGCADSQITDKPAYLEKKEKVIGISLPVKANAQQALNGFLDELSPVPKKLLNDNCQIILKNFKEAGYNNLRVLRQSCLRFNTVISSLTVKETENTTFITDLVGNYFPLALEIYGGKLGDDSIEELYKIDAIISRLEESKNNPASHEERKDKRKQFNESFLNKYSTLSHSSVGWTLDSISPIWVDFFMHGVIDLTHFATAISAHQAFYDESTPSWKKLWYWKHEDLTQVDFEKYLTDVLQKINSKKYKTFSEVMHVWCIVLGIQEKGCWPLSIGKNYLVGDGVDYITDRMQDPDFLSKDLIRSDYDKSELMFEGLDGLGLHGASNGQFKSAYFIALNQSFNDGLEKRQIEYKKQSTDEFISLINTDIYQLNDYLDNLQSLFRSSLFEGLDLNLLIDKFNTPIEKRLAFYNLSYVIKKQLKGGYIDKDKPVIKTNFTNLKTVIIEELAQAKANRSIVVVQIEYLLAQIDKVLGIPPAVLPVDVESVVNI